MLLALVFFACADAPAPSPAATVVSPPRAVVRALLREVHGDVKVKHAAGDEWVAAADAQQLVENDKIRTAKGASAVVRFTNGSTLALGEDALISIAESRPKPGQDASDVTVHKGRVDAELDEATKESLSVSTPAAMIRAGRELVFQ